MKNIEEYRRNGITYTSFEIKINICQTKRSFEKVDIVLNLGPIALCIFVFTLYLISLLIFSTN